MRWGEEALPHGRMRLDRMKCVACGYVHERCVTVVFVDGRYETVVVRGSLLKFEQCLACGAKFSYNRIESSEMVEVGGLVVWDEVGVMGKGEG